MSGHANDIQAKSSSTANATTTFAWKDGSLPCPKDKNNKEKEVTCMSSGVSGAEQNMSWSSTMRCMKDFDKHNPPPIVM